MAKEKKTRQSAFRGMKPIQVVDPAAEHKDDETQFSKDTSSNKEIIHEETAENSLESLVDSELNNEENLSYTKAEVTDESAESLKNEVIEDNGSGGVVDQPVEAITNSTGITRYEPPIPDTSQIPLATHPKQMMQPAQTTQSSSNTLMKDMVASPQPPSEGKAIRLNAGIHIEANRKNIRSHRGSYSLSDKAYLNLVRLAEITNNSYNEIFNRLLEDIEFEDVITE